MHEVFLAERSLNQPKATLVCIRSTNQSNRFVYVRLLFLFCSCVFISRSYENRSHTNRSHTWNIVPDRAGAVGPEGLAGWTKSQSSLLNMFSVSVDSSPHSYLFTSTTIHSHFTKVWYKTYTWLSAFEIDAVQLRSATEVAPKWPFVCGNGSPTRRSFCAGVRSIRYHSVGNGSENVSFKMNFRFFNLCCVYSNLLKMASGGEFPWSWLLEDRSQV